MRDDLYSDIIKRLEKDGFYKQPITVTHLNPYLVTTFSVHEKWIFGKVLELICPSGRIMTMCGSEGSGVDLRDFCRAPHLYSTPHQFSIRCFSKDNVEPSPLTVIRIEKIKPNLEINRIDEVLYGDISLTYGERFKRKEERYYFSDTIKLYGQQCLRLLPINPDIDITRTELFMKCDLLTKRE